jgi:hypothetical protein
MKHFRKISYGPHQWLVRPLSGYFVSREGEASHYLLVGYTNPKSTGLPNHLVYGLPIASYRSGPESETELRICCEQATAIPLSRGLYWSDRDLRYNPDRDWSRFWEPTEGLFPELGTAKESVGRERDKEFTMEREWRTLEGDTYIDSLTACLKRWSQERQVLQDALQD